MYFSNNKLSNFSRHWFSFLEAILITAAFFLLSESSQVKQPLTFLFKVNYLISSFLIGASVLHVIYILGDKIREKIDAKEEMPITRWRQIPKRLFASIVELLIYLFILWGIINAYKLIG